MKNQTKEVVLVIIAAVCFLLFAIMVFKGYDKMTNYKNPESALLESINAYVGGDAYNYIINGTYATAYYVLAAGFFISGIICIIGSMIFSVETVSVKNTGMLSSSNNLSSDEDKLPPL